MTSKWGAFMSVVTEILNLQKDRISSVSRLLAALDWQKSASERDRFEYRSVAVTEAADLILLNVAAHCAEALSEPPTIHKTRRAIVPFRRKPRRSDPGRLHQRRLFG
jgi:hypothetical protein